MSLGPTFYAGQTEEFGGDVKTIAEALAGYVRRGEEGDALYHLLRLKERAYRVVDAAETAIAEMKKP